MKKFSSEELKQMVIETINDSGDTNYKRVFDVIWSNIDNIISDDIDIEIRKENLNQILQLYAQMITLESVNLTLNALVKTGTLGEDFRD